MGRRARKNIRIESVSTRIRRPGAARRLAWSTLLAYPFACTLGMALEARGALNVMLGAVINGSLLIAPIVVLIAVIYLSNGGWAKKAPLAVEGDELILSRDGREQRVAIDRIDAGLLVPAVSSSARVDLQLNNGDVVGVYVDEATSAAELLDAVGVDPAHRRFAMKLRRYFHQILGVIVGLPMLATFIALATRPNNAAAAVGLVGVLATLLSIWRVYMGPNIVVGSDGMVVDSGFRKRFLPYSSLEKVATGTGCIEIQFKNGRREKVWANVDDFSMVRALVGRIQNAMTVEDAGVAAPGFGLAREGRTFNVWRAALAGLTDASATYRKVALTRDDIVRVLEDAKSGVEARIAAALALSGSKDSAALERIRVTADACASDPLRKALQRVASGDIDEDDVERAVKATGPEELSRVAS